MYWCSMEEFSNVKKIEQFSSCKLRKNAYLQDEKTFPVNDNSLHATFEVKSAM